MDIIGIITSTIITLSVVGWVWTLTQHFRKNKKIVFTIILSFIISYIGAILLFWTGVRADETGSSPERIWGQWESIPWILFFGGAVVVLFFAMRMIIEKRENKK